MNFHDQREMYNSKVFGNYKFHRLKKILPFIPKREVKLLDVACGASQFYDSLKKYRSNIDYFGVDLSDEQVKVSVSKGYNVKKHDLTRKFPFPDNSFDVVSATEIIEHLFNTDFFLSEINRILKPSGVIILTTPNCLSLGDRLRFLFGNSKTLEYHSRVGTSGHIRYFDIDKIKEIFKYNQFKIQNITGRDFYLPLIYYGSGLDFINYFLSNLFPSLSAGFIVVAKKI